MDSTNRGGMGTTSIRSQSGLHHQLRTCANLRSMHKQLLRTDLFVRRRIYSERQLRIWDLHRNYASSQFDCAQFFLPGTKQKNSPPPVFPFFPPSSSFPLCHSDCFSFVSLLLTYLILLSSCSSIVSLLHVMP